MFLSEAQLNLLSTVYEYEKVDILETNISTLSALTCRGLVEVNYARKPGAITKVELTDAGEAIASHIDFYRELPAYKAVLDKTREAKRARYHG
jgi:hypothetical protein